ANASIVSIRREIRSTRDRVRQVDAIQSHLSAMTRSCNRYLELSDASPDRYAMYLGDLRRELTPIVERLARTHRGIANQKPGGGTASHLAVERVDELPTFRESVPSGVTRSASPPASAPRSRRRRAQVRRRLAASSRRARAGRRGP